MPRPAKLIPRALKAMPATKMPADAAHTPKAYSKRTGTNFIYLEIWGSDGDHIQTWVPGVSKEDLAKVSVPLLELMANKERKLPAEKYAGRMPYDRPSR